MVLGGAPRAPDREGRQTPRRADRGAPAGVRQLRGTIPEGHYGAGEVRIFDDGWYEPVEWTDTKVSFRLHGRRYPDLEFHFVKTRTDWLAFLASANTAPTPARPPAVPADARRGGGQPFDDTAWRFRPKLDGMRARRDGDGRDGLPDAPRADVSSSTRTST